MSEGLALFHSEAVGISDRFPKLIHLVDDSGRPYIEGIIDLKESNGSIIDSYQIAIKPTYDYPYAFPKVYELGGRIPKNLDWHIFTEGYCCLKALPEEILICSRGITLVDFISNQIIPYFFNQKHRELYGYFLTERSHEQGNVEFLYEIFKTKDKVVIKRCLAYIDSGKKPDRTDTCFCGSRKKYRKCHRDTYNQLNHFTHEQLSMYLILLGD